GGNLPSVLGWVAWRPGEVGNYGNREMGVVLSALAIVGTLALGRRTRAWPVLLGVPFALAVTAALLGRFPLAHRTTVFLLPCLWLLSAAGVAQVFRYGRPWATALTLAALLPLTSDVVHLGETLCRPDPHVDYRGAYRFVEA